MTLKHTPLLAVAVLALVLAGCGGGRVSASSSPAHGIAFTRVLHLTADPSGDYGFVPASLTAGPGKSTVELYNPPSTFGPHGIAIDGPGVHAAGLAAPRGGVSRVTATLKPGRYELYSAVGGDRGNGMFATLTVHGAANSRPHA
jgi:plastocyanin